MTLVKKLLVNSDDFGLSTAINAGILRSHASGIVTSTSLVASGAAFGEAVKQSLLHPALGIGVHLTLVEELAVSRTPTLAPNGLLPRTYGDLMKRIVTGQIRPHDIECEFRAQIEKCIAAGLKLTHLDSHQHTHTWPTLFPIALKLGSEYGIPGIRIPRGWPRLHDFSAPRFLPKCVLCLLAHADALLIPRKGRKAAEHFAGLFETGDLTQPSLLRILATLQPGSTELVSHPGCDDPSSRYSSWNLRRQTELATLTSDSVKKAVRDLGIELINYNQL